MTLPSDGPAGELIPPITGSSIILGVFGHPVEHSLSPAMHNAAIAALGLHYVYIPFSVPPEDIGPAIRSLVPLGIRGVNLTIPHKESVLPFLDAVAPEAKAVGAVNTVLNEGGRLSGYNTDGEGFLRPLIERGFSARGKQAVVLGAGGAARSVVYRLLREGAKVVIVNRTPDRAERLAAEMREAAGSPHSSEVSCIELGDGIGCGRAIERAEILVNTTSAGMSPNAGEMPPIPPTALHPALFVVDLIYNPSETLLLRTAAAAGARTLNGVPMLVHQGAAAFEIWTGRRPPTGVMERVVTQKLRERQAH